jgi:hypothetical protein
MKQYLKRYLNTTNLKILTILIGLIATITFLGDRLYILRIYESTGNTSYISVGDEVARLFFCWCPYFFFKVLENKLENYFEKIGFTRKEDDK